MFKEIFELLFQKNKSCGKIYIHYVLIILVVLTINPIALINYLLAFIVKNKQIFFMLLLVFGVLFIKNFIYDYFIPEYCMDDTIENRNSLSAYGFEISEKQSSQNTICFRSNDQELVQDLIKEINDNRLEKEFQLQKIKEENKFIHINKLLEEKYFYPILLVLFIWGLFYITTKNNNHY